MDSNSQRRFLFWLATTIAVIIVMSVIFFTTLPSATKWKLNDWLAEQGASSQIDDIDINFFTGEIRLTSVKPEVSQKRNLDLGNLYAKIRLRDLWRKKITIENVSLSDFYIDIKQTPVGIYSLGGIKTGTNNQEPDSKSNNTTNSSQWTFSIGKLEVKNTKTCYIKSVNSTQDTYDVCLLLESFKLNKTSGYLIEHDSQKDVLVSKASFIIKNAKLYENKHNTEIMKVGELRAEKIKVDKHNKINIPKLDVSGVTLLKRDNIKPETEKDIYATTVKSITLSNINIMNFDDYLIDSISITGLQSQLLREKSGQLELAKDLQAFVTPTKQSGKSTEKKGTKAPRLRIGNLHITDNSSIAIVDYAVTPVFREQIANLNLKLGNVDTHETTKDSPIEIAFAIGEYGKVVLNGNVVLFAKRPTTALIGTIESLNIANYTGYAFNFIQHQVKSGKMDAGLNIKSHEGILDTEMKLNLHKFYIEEGGESVNKQYEKEIGAPLPKALSMLRDKDDSIKITLSVRGDMKDPQFSYATAIKQIMADTIRSSIINYYANFGLRITILKSFFKLTKSLRFEPVIYQPLDVNLDNSNKELLNDLVTLLNERPKIELAICGYATRQDRLKLYTDKKTKSINTLDDEVDEEFQQSVTESVLPKSSPEQITRLDELALQRQTILKNYLVEEKGIEPKRLIPCNPKYSDTDKGEPRVEFSL